MMKGITPFQKAGIIVKETFCHPRLNSQVDLVTGQITRTIPKSQPSAAQIFNRMVEVFKGVFK